MAACNMQEVGSSTHIRSYVKMAHSTGHLIAFILVPYKQIKIKK
jgi:hypothetical protein